jgi:hypothetical protein
MTQSKTVLHTPAYSEAFKQSIPKLNNGAQRNIHPLSSTEFSDPNKPADTWEGNPPAN